MIFETEEVKRYRIEGEPNDKIALIDADTIAYGACSVHEYEYYDVKTGTEVYDINIEDALSHALDHVEKIIAATGCKDAELHFTSGTNFRYTVDPTYKSNRVGTRRPEGLKEIKVLMLDHYPGTMNVEVEADDMVVYLKKKYPEKYILCAVDKDVLKATEGKHWNYYSSERYNIEPKWVEVDELSAIRYNYLQAIMGDTNDGIKGVPGIGPKGAEKFLPEQFNCEADLWNGVVAAFKSKGLTVIDAMVTMQLVSMHQLIDDENGEPKLELFDPTKWEVDSNE